VAEQRIGSVDAVGGTPVIVYTAGEYVYLTFGEGGSRTARLPQHADKLAALLAQAMHRTIQQRAVTAEDYESVAEPLPGVSRPDPPQSD
jgi:hypothetical protein